MEKVNTKESWNKKRIFITLFLLALLVAGSFFFKTQVLDINTQTDKSFKAVSSEDKKTENQKKDEGSKINIQSAIKEKIYDLQQQVITLDVMEIASSSPQIQKIINDIKSLEQYPVNQAKEICRQICGL